MEIMFMTTWNGTKHVKYKEIHRPQFSKASTNLPPKPGPNAPTPYYASLHPPIPNPCDGAKIQFGSSQPQVAALLRLNLRCREITACASSRQQRGRGKGEESDSAANFVEIKDFWECSNKKLQFPVHPWMLWTSWRSSTLWFLKAPRLKP